MAVESCLVKLYLLRPEVRDPVPKAEGQRSMIDDRGPRAECRALDDDGGISSCVMFYGSFVQSKNFVAL